MNTFQHRNKSASLIMLAGTFVNLALFFIKLWIGLASNNIGILTDAINNLGDVLGCFLSLICFYLTCSNKKNESFPHGFGRLEQISSFVMSMIVIFIGGYFFISSINRMMIASLVLFKWTYFIILLLTVFVKITLAIFYKWQNKKINSDVLKCAIFDSILDASITFMTVIGLLLTKFVQLRLDGLFGICVSTLMIIGGIRLFLTNLKGLIGAPLPASTQQRIIEKLEQCDAIEKILSIEYHDYGLDERTLYVTAVFTNNGHIDIIKKVCTEIYEENGLKIHFVCEV